MLFNMNVASKKIKNVLFGLMAITVSLIALELLMFLLLLCSMVKSPENDLLKKFPAQFRMDADEISKFFPAVSPLSGAGQFLGFTFDPVLGYRQLEALEWYGDTGKNLDEKFLVVTFGGSTTVKDNWPKYLRKYAEVENVQEDVVVLNAGLWGYMSFNERIYFTSWILPMLEKMKMKPDLILTMDGVNDIWYRILGYMASERNSDSIWYEQYHGYHQQHDIDMHRIRTSTGAMFQLASNMSRTLYKTSIRVMPYTIKVLESFLRKNMENPIQNTTDRSIIPEQKRLGEQLEMDIIKAFEYTLTDFLGSAMIRDIPFVGYLQPVAVTPYYDHPMPDTHYYPGINYMGISLKRTNSMFTELYCDHVVDTKQLYHQADLLYKELSRRYPGQFRSIIDIFKEIPVAGELFERDSIHYRQKGKEIIAQTVIKDLIKKGILTQSR